MDWQNWSERLKRELALDREPIAVSFTREPAPEATAGQGKLSVCQAIEKSSKGEAVFITKETCGCPGGLVSLGLGQSPPQAKEKLISFLVDKEKVYCSRVALHRSQQILEPPLGMAGCVSFAPLAQAAERPDIVAFVGKPGSLHHLLSLAAFWNGGSMKAELCGPACRTGIAYPVVTGEIGLSLFDFGARRLAHCSDDHLLIGVPFPRMIGILQALDQGAGRAGVAETETEIDRQIDELGGVV